MNMKQKIPFLILLFLSNFVFGQSCDNWLSTLPFPSYVSVGDVDVIGDQLTVEANINESVIVQNNNYGHVVSKHSSGADINYGLFFVGCEITTKISGYKSVVNLCNNTFKKTYHIAMVYDGVNLKFYKNGYLLGITPCKGDMVNNNLSTAFGQVALDQIPNDQFRGYINEVRIWNVARTQIQLQTYMNKSLPSPTTQKGLLAYYTFDNLKNKQGNEEFDGKLNGEAKIKETNPNCTFVADSCIKIEKDAPSIEFISSITKCNAVDFKITTTKNIDSYKWDFGDNTFSTDKKITHTYKKAGKYKVKLIAKGKNGKEILEEDIIKIENITTDFTFQQTSNYQKINFKTKNNNTYKYTWHFGEGKKVAGENLASYTYKNDGNYNVTLYTENKNGCKDTVTKTITIKAPTPKKADEITIVKPSASNNTEIEARMKDVVKVIEVVNDSVQVSFYDNGVVDGDSVTVIYNNQIITSHLLLTAKGKTFSLAIDKSNETNELIMYAENLGSIPPNTALMVIYDGKIRHEVNISSSTFSNGTVNFVFKKQ